MMTDEERIANLEKAVIQLQQQVITLMHERLQRQPYAPNPPFVGPLLPTPPVFPVEIICTAGVTQNGGV